jgi:hypothetical protein
MNIWLSWSEVFQLALKDVWVGFIQFTPKFIIAIVLFMIGWLLGNVIARALEQVMGSLKVDHLFKSIGLDETLRRAGMTLNSGYFIGQVAKWFMVVVFLIPSLDLVGLSSIRDFLQGDVLGFLPRVIIAAFILIIATVLSDGLSKAATATAKSMDVASAGVFGAVAKYTIWIFAVLIALGQLGIAGTAMQILLTGIVFMLSLGGALAFGLGGREHASRLLSKIENEFSQK